jgi:hypothetical protein
MSEGFILPSAGKTSLSFRFAGPITHPELILFIGTPQQQRPSPISVVCFEFDYYFLVIIITVLRISILLTRNTIDWLILKQPELEKTTISSSCPSWKPLFENLCRSMALPLMIHFILSRRSFPIVRTRRPRHFATPPMGLIDLVRRAPPASAPLLLSPSVGPHNERPASPPLLLSPSDNERPASPPLVMSPSDNPQPQSEFYGQLLFEVMAAYSDFPFRGTLFINDGMTLSYIYNRSGRDCRDFFSRKKEWLTRHADSSEKFKVCIYTPSL